MSIEINNESKTIAEVKEERTWRSEIFSEKGQDYKLVIHREIVTTQDGDVISVDKQAPQVPQFTASITDLIASEDIIDYKDVSGADKTIPLKDLPFLVTAGYEKLIADEKERLAALPPVE